MGCCNCGAVAVGLLKSTPPVVLNAETITDLVEQAGGNVNAIFRGSLAWNSWSDVDFHMNEPGGGDHIFFSHKQSALTKGELDVDMNVNSNSHTENTNKYSRPAVENIMYTDLQSMPNGDYKFSFVQYGVYDRRQPGEDAPYLLIEYRQPEEPKLSHYALLKFNGPNQPKSTATQVPLATVRKTGANFELVELAPNVTIVKQHDFNTNFPTSGGDSSSDTAGAATSGRAPT